MASSALIHNNEPLPFVTFNPATGQHSLHASRAYAKDEVIVSFQAGSVLLAPTYLTIQIGDDAHLTLQPGYLQYVNHSCAPNAFFNTTSMKFIALEAIQQGDELCFFYPATEWQMAQAFTCHCGSSNCLKTIRGAAFIADAVLKNYRVTDFIFRKNEESR